MAELIYNNQYRSNFKPVVDFLSYLKKSTRIFSTLYTDPYFHWKITSNPFGESACFLRYQGEVAVSHCSVTAKPLNLWLDAGVGCAEMGDTHTHPRYQKRGHFGALGSHAIKAFDQSIPHGSKLIYGFPNENALPGWVRHCNCELYQQGNIVELTRNMLRSKSSVLKECIHWVLGRRREAIGQFSLCTDEHRTIQEITELWGRTGNKENHLINKDGAWWAWRYKESSEAYRTYAWKENHSAPVSAYIILKVQWYRLRYLQICDILAVSEADRFEAFQEFIRTMVLPIDIVQIWVQTSTTLAEIAVREGFVKRRDIVFFFYKNEAYARLFKQKKYLLLALGDSDNA